MRFTPKKSVRSLIAGTLTVTVAGLLGWLYQFGPVPSTAPQQPYTVEQTLPAAHSVPILAVSGSQDLSGYSYQPVSSWYKNKHWWKRNAPIVGGAGGGALIGGLAGGGTGALIGGAAGAGGGALYKHYHHRHHRHYYNDDYRRR
jgi:hypothetical protein